MKKEDEYCPELSDGPVKGRHHWILRDILDTQDTEIQKSGFRIFVCTECGQTKLEEFSLNYGLNHDE